MQNFVDGLGKSILKLWKTCCVLWISLGIIIRLDSLFVVLRCNDVISVDKVGGKSQFFRKFSTAFDFVLWVKKMNPQLWKDFS